MFYRGSIFCSAGQKEKVGIKSMGATIVMMKKEQSPSLRELAVETFGQ